MIRATITLLATFITTFLAQATSFELTYQVPEHKPVHPIQGYVVITQNSRLDPMDKIFDWFNFPNLYSAIDTDRDGKLIIDDKANSFPTQLSKLAPGKYKAQAIVRLANDYYKPGQGKGDVYSNSITFEIIAGEKAPHLKLKCHNISKGLPELKRGRIILSRLKSKALSEFFKRDYYIHYSIILPKNYDKTKKYPVVVYNPGYTGECSNFNHVLYKQDSRINNCIVAFPSPNCYWGHSVFADSATNGPWGQAITQDFMPFIDKTYGGAGPKHRYLTGVSSGGWSSLWLMINYPKHFAGTWSYAPDPLDFHNFQRLDLYDKKTDNLYTRKNGDLIPLCFPLENGKSLKYKTMASFEKALGAGSQLKSFGAVFSPSTKAGNPQPWYDEETGAIDKTVTAHWAKYDICKIFPAIWKKHQIDLTGKINLLVHKKDFFFLTHSVRSFERTCKEIGSDATFTYIRGAGHHIPTSSTKPMYDTIEKNWKHRTLQDQ